jgi:hypothetical protein
MKKLQVILLVLAVPLLVYPFTCTGLVMHDGQRSTGDTTHLLSTHWKQMGGFEKHTPDSLRVGCWSTALAQIMYYHRLMPYGKVSYISRNGYRINENIDSSRMDFRHFTSSLDSASSLVSADQMALYSYYAALAMRKDFGTDRYMNKLAPADLLESHYRVKVKRFISWHCMLPYGTGKLEKVIVREIDAARPVFLHFANLKDFGHSVVVDGYQYRDGNLFVHINQGQGGQTDGWYAFRKGILREDDTALRVVYSFAAR